ncbi:MAG: hypothetical protein HQL27_08710, partial [Candidatus Omnitrophica bacterium]|nr:hypothetical protein [Candidatus Omnitrophota bacterium]
MKIVWLSANLFGFEVLKEVLAKTKLNVSCVITLSPRSKIVMYDGIKNSLWDTLGVKIIRVERLKFDLLKNINPDLVVMCGWRQKIDKETLRIPHKGFIGFHPTLLPFGRGPAPIINCIKLGIKKGGVTMFYPSCELDDGDIIGQEKFDILESDYAFDVYEKVVAAGKKLAVKYLPKVIKG